MYVLNKKMLKNRFIDYADLANELGYKNITSFRRDRGYNILDDDVVLCPEKLKKRFDKNGYKDMYYTVDEKILINAMIYGKFVISNDVMRVVVGLMLDGLTKKPAKVYWSFSDLRVESEYKINEKNIEKVFTAEESKAYFEKNKETGQYSLNVQALTRSCQ